MFKPWLLQPSSLENAKSKSPGAVQQTKDLYCHVSRLTLSSPFAQSASLLLFSRPVCLETPKPTDDVEWIEVQDSTGRSHQPLEIGKALTRSMISFQKQIIHPTKKYICVDRFIPLRAGAFRIGRFAPSDPAICSLGGGLNGLAEPSRKRPRDEAKLLKSIQSALKF